MTSKKKPQKKVAKASKKKWRTESRIKLQAANAWPYPAKKKTRSLSSDNGSDRQLVLSFPGTITPMALLLNPVLKYEEWSTVGAQLRRVKEFIQFAIGDWLNHGEQHYGEMYSQAASDTGLPEETLMILKHVSSRVAPESRIKDLTWSHHREVAKFPPEEQTKWLEKALSKHWSVRDLKDALKKASGKDHDGQEEGEDKEGREEGPPTGEGCEACGAAPAGMRACGQCMAVASKAISTVGIRGAIELLNRKPSKPQIEMLRWAYQYINQPSDQDPQAEAEWEARYEALQKVVDKAA